MSMLWSKWRVAGAAAVVALAVAGPADPARAQGEHSHTEVGPGRPACVPSSQPRPKGPPKAGSPCNDNELTPGSDYHPAKLHLAAHRPYLPLSDYTARPASDATAVAFRQYVDRAVAGHPDYGYQPIDAVTLYARTKAPKYIKAAIKEVDAEVVAADKAIAHRQAPVIASDDYLDVGPDLESLAFTYDRGYSRLTASQRRHWKAYGDQVLSNVWSPRLATWGTASTGSFGWDGWSINNPGNNYNYSFIQATETWALATHETAWFKFLQTYEFPRMTTYFEGIVGGGSREGTGYGTAQGRLWANARLWREATGERLSSIEAHARASIDYWVNATVPTLDYFAPIGDLSRESLPEIYDYQTNLVREAAMAAPNTPQAGHALWWIKNNAEHDHMQSSFNLRDALLEPKGTVQAPTELTYDAPGVGQLFARSSWTTDATWLDVSAGPYDESHAHEDQGGFTLYRGTWLAVTPNIWSHSGLQGNGNYDDIGSAASDIIRFDSAHGTIDQVNGKAAVTTSTHDGTVSVHADLSPVYRASQVSAWTRDLSFSGNTLTVDDVCTAATGVTPVWQLQVPVKPTVTGGMVTAGSLTASFDPSYQVKVVDLAAVNDDFAKGWRVELTHPGSCSFHVVMTAGA